MVDRVTDTILGPKVGPEDGMGVLNQIFRSFKTEKLFRNRKKN